MRVFQLFKVLLILLGSAGLSAVFGCETAAEDGAETEDSGGGETDPWDTGSGERDTGFVSDAGVLFPGEVWPEGDAEAHGFDETELEAAAEEADAADSHCLMVVHQGAAVGAWYFDDWDADTRQNVFSVTKSLTSVVVGMAEDRGYLSTEDFASDYIAEWQGTESESVTVRHLLSNTSGREWVFWDDYVTLNFQTDRTAYAVGLLQDWAPGETWEYNNSAIQTLDRLFFEAAGERIADFAGGRLLAPLGMSAYFGTDEAGNTVTFSDFQSSCGDLARFGYLVLQNGVWGNEQIVSSEYLAEATAPSSELNTAYGYLFWLNGDGHWVKPSVSETERAEGDGRIYPTLPDDLIIAEGMQDQLVVISPSEELVITRIGGKGDPVEAALSANLGNDDFVESLVGRILDAKTP